QCAQRHVLFYGVTNCVCLPAEPAAVGREESNGFDAGTVCVALEQLLISRQCRSGSLSPSSCLPGRGSRVSSSAQRQSEHVVEQTFGDELVGDDARRLVLFSQRVEQLLG